MYPEFQGHPLLKDTRRRRRNPSSSTHRRAGGMSLDKQAPFPRRRRHVLRRVDWLQRDEDGRPIPKGVVASVKPAAENGHVENGHALETDSTAKQKEVS